MINRDTRPDSYSRQVIRAACFILMACASSCSSRQAVDFQVHIDKGYNQVFTRTSGWTGGDIAASVGLSGSRVLWLFGDSWIGPVVAGRHEDAVMIHNAIAIQRGTAPAAGNVTFYYKNKDGRPVAFFSPPDATGKLWLTGGGIHTVDGLFLVAAQVVSKPDDTSVFGFETVANWLIHIKNPQQAPEDWHWRMSKIPFFRRFADGGDISFGAPQFIHNGYFYIYGSALRRETANRYMVLARAPADRLTDFAGWEFFHQGRWLKNCKQPTYLCDHFGAEYSVSYQPLLKKYVAVYSKDGLSAEIHLRTAGKPEGPWSNPVLIYTAPEETWSDDYFCYAAKAHPELSAGDNDLLISYVCNAYDFFKMAADAEIYKPKFIRVSFHSH